MGVNAVISQLITVLQVVPGISPIEDFPTEQAAFSAGQVCALAFSVTGDWRIFTHDDGAGHLTALTTPTIKIRVMVNRAELAEDFRLLMPFADSVPLALLNAFDRDRFAGTALALGDIRSPGAAAAISFTGPVAGIYGGVPTLELQFAFICSIELPVGG